MTDKLAITKYSVRHGNIALNILNEREINISLATFTIYPIQQLVCHF